MCDTFVALPPATADGAVIFGKNSDRERNEAQAIERHPAADHAPGAVLAVTRIAIEQVRHTREVLISRPFWMWGAEIGANDAGVVIGNEAVHSVRPPGQAPALLGMDLVRLGLERAGSAAEACEVICRLLARHGQGGNCGHLHQHFYHNSFLVADAREAFVLETVDREWEVARADHIRSISNAYTLPGMRAHADAVLEARGDGPARCARTAAVLGAAAGRIGVREAMAALRDHGPAAGSAWHPQDTVGRTVCMHAGAGERRGQSVASMVSELREGRALHWVTGTSAPCTGVFKPMIPGVDLPAGPTPTDRADAASLWWQHERLHRALLRSVGGLPGWLVTERDALEADFVRRTRGVVDAAVILSCWKDAAAAELRWSQRAPGTPPISSAYSESWSALDREAALTG